MADSLPFGKDARPEYPPVHPRRGLTPGQKKLLRDSQDGRCNGCGIKPKRWEYDHICEVWEGGSSTDFANWQALGARTDCDCHRAKSAEKTAQRAAMNRIRKKALKETRKPAVMRSGRKLEGRSSFGVGRGFEKAPANFKHFGRRK